VHRDAGCPMVTGFRIPVQIPETGDFFLPLSQRLGRPSFSQWEVAFSNCGTAMIFLDAAPFSFGGLPPPPKGSTLRENKRSVPSF